MAPERPSAPGVPIEAQARQDPQPPRVPITRPDLGPEAAEAVARVVRSGWVMQGPEVAAFEEEIARAVGAPHAVAVSSGTAALELALRVLGIGTGDEVVTVSHSFIATANCVRAVGARPVFIDVEEDTFGMDPKGIEAALTPRTRAILCVHQLGIPCDLPAILAVASRRGLPVIEDAACAIGSEVGWTGSPESPWERIGKPHGVIACFSFHPRKVITTGDGGMLTTADPALAERLRRLRNHGMSVSPEARDRDPLHGEAYLEPGYNCRLTDLQAALGRAQLARLDASLAERRRLAASFIAMLADHPVLLAPQGRPGTRSNWQSFPARLRQDSPLSQAEVLRFFAARGVSCRGGLTNAHREPAYAAAALTLPVSERLKETTVLLPLFHGMTPAEEVAVRAALQELR